MTPYASKADRNNIPLAYRIFFLYIEPLAVLIGAYFAARDPEAYLSRIWPHTWHEPSSFPVFPWETAGTFVVLHQLTNLSLFRALAQVLVLSVHSTTAGSLGTWRALLGVLLVADAGYLAAFLPVLHLAGWWQIVMSRDVAFVCAAAGMRIAFLSRFGFKRPRREDIAEAVQRSSPEFKPQPTPSPTLASSPSRELSSIPLPYRVVFLYLEPLAALACACFIALRPEAYLAHHSAPAQPRPPSIPIFPHETSTSTFVVLYRLASLFLFCALAEAFVLRSAETRRTWRALLGALLVADMGRLAALFPLARVVGWLPTFVSGDAVVVYAAAGVWVAFLLGYGFKAEREGDAETEVEERPILGRNNDD